MQCLQSQRAKKPLPPRRHLRLQQLRKLSVLNAKVFATSDRQVVEDAIGSWFGNLEEFDKFVREGLVAI